MNTSKAFLHSKFKALVVLLFVISACLLFSVNHTLTAAETRTETESESGSGQKLADEESELVRIMNLNLRYMSLAIRNSAEAFADWKNEEILPILYLSREQAENGIRPVSHAIYCIGLALYYDYYDEEIVGVSKEDAEAMCIKLIDSVVEEHRSNHPDDQEDRYWGDSWQSPLWAENIALGAWLLRDQMDPEIYEKVERMVLDEADTLTYDFEIPYYMDEDGTIVYPGDTKGEELAWRTKILALACFMFPDSEKVSDWSDRLERMLIASTAMPDDVDSDRVVDGLVVGDVLSGSNVNEDGTVVNHDRVHIDYMATILEEMGDTVTVFKIADAPVPEAAVFNLDKIYDGLIYVDLGKFDEKLSGRNFYLRDENGQPTGETKMPGDNDWGKPGYAIYYLLDVMADTLELDADVEAAYKGYVWEELHFEKMREQIDRETDGEITGQFFQPGENFFVSGELFMMHNLAEAYVLKYAG